MITEYDPVTCIHAGELRQMGFNVPSEIPDCGWVPRGSMQTVASSSTASDDSMVLTTNLEVTFTQPFKWFSASFTAEKRKD